MSNGATAAAGARGKDSEGGELADNKIKLVAYFIVSLKPGRERLLPRGADTIIVTSNMSDEAFTTYVVARYYQSSAYTELSRDEKVAVESERKYLRVHFNVVHRWPREPRKYEERQIAALDGIREALAGD